MPKTASWSGMGWNHPMPFFDDSGSILESVCAG
jgi:hypothetical protein